MVFLDESTIALLDGTVEHKQYVEGKEKNLSPMFEEDHQVFWKDYCLGCHFRSWH